MFRTQCRDPMPAERAGVCVHLCDVASIAMLVVGALHGCREVKCNAEKSRFRASTRMYLCSPHLVALPAASLLTSQQQNHPGTLAFDILLHVQVKHQRNSPSVASFAVDLTVCKEINNFTLRPYSFPLTTRTSYFLTPQVFIQQ